LRRLDLDEPPAARASLDYRLDRFAVCLGRAHDLEKPLVLSPASAEGAQLLVIEAARMLRGES
jgi:hypothetical protein